MKTQHIEDDISKKNEPRAFAISKALLVRSFSNNCWEKYTYRNLEMEKFYTQICTGGEGEHKEGETCIHEFVFVLRPSVSVLLYSDVILVGVTPTHENGRKIGNLQFR